MAKAKGINWKAIIAAALHVLINQGKNNAHEAVRQVLEEEKIATGEITINEYDGAVAVVQSLNDTLSETVA